MLCLQAKLNSHHISNSQNRGNGVFIFFILAIRAQAVFFVECIDMFNYFVGAIYQYK